MEPFTVICETCRARLKVRSADAIGQIHACPRCESMVLIAAPAIVAAPAIATGPALAATPAASEDFAQFEASPAAESFSHVVAPSQVAADAFAAAAVAALDGVSASHEMPIIHPSIGAAASPAMPAANNWHAAILAKLVEQPALWLWGAGMAAAVLVGGLTFALWPGREDASAAPTVLAAVDPADSLDTPGAPDSLPSPSEAQLTSNNEHEPSKVTTAVAVTPTADVATDAIELPELPAVDAIAEPAKEVVPLAAQAESDSKATDLSESIPTNTARRVAVLKIDPLTLDPAHLSLPIGVPPGSAPPTSIANSSVAEAAPAADDSAAFAAADRDAPAMSEDDRTVTVRRGPPSSEQPFQRDAAGQIAMPLQSISMQGVSLEKFIRIISDMADVPITLEPAAIEMTGVSAGRELSVDVSGGTIEGVLHDVLASNRMGFIVQDGHVVVVRPTADTRRPRDYDVADLVANGLASAEQLAEWIERFVAPDTWQSVGGLGTIAVEGSKLRIEQSDRVHIAALLFCERLRVARGLSPKSAYPIERLNTESPYARIAARLNQTTTFTFAPWTRLVEVVRDWQEQSGLAMLVDWRALAELELTRSSPVTCSVVGRTWEDALDAILTPLELGWWAIDGETIQITSRPAVDRLQRVEMFAIAPPLREQFASDAALIEALQSEVRSRAGTGGTHCEMAVDGGRLIVLGNAAAHRYLTQRLASE